MTTGIDFACFAREEGERRSLYMQVDGMTCAACAWTIEQSLQAHPGVEARVNFSTQRLRLSWPVSLPVAAANDFAQEISELGYKVAPFDHDSRLREAKAAERSLLACLAVAGFATGNIMLFSQALWFSPAGSLEGATRDLMHWIMALIALPATIWCGRPFFFSALGALKHGRTNMDVPISLAVILANALSLFETIRHGHYVYFDASVMLLFFLLIGRFLDLRARGKAREAAEGLLAMLEGTALIVEDGIRRSVRIRDLKPNQKLLVAPGEKIAADGIVVSGESDIDTQLVTGETLPRTARPGDRLFAGMINQTASLVIEISASADSSLLSEIISLMERAEQSQSPYVRFADKVARLYAPVVHCLALATFLGWLLFGYLNGGSVVWEDALLKAMAVLIITCPCALGLAVPVVHVIASSQLFAKGILLKSGKALEALAVIDTVVFDKTGTLTEGMPHWQNAAEVPADVRQLAVAMAMHSRHPLSQAVAAAGFGPAGPLNLIVKEDVGQGLVSDYDGLSLRLGKASWLNIETEQDSQSDLWFVKGAEVPLRFVFGDTLRADAASVISAFQARGIRVCMLSGDRRDVADRTAMALGIAHVHAELSPVDKVSLLDEMAQAGRKVLMVGDGLNDAAALTAAFVSMSPATAVDMTQNAADLVYRGQDLQPVYTAYDLACRTKSLVRQNFALSLTYNAIAVPAAILGFVTPLVAALAMSGSSLLVVLNSMRLKHKSS